MAKSILSNAQDFRFVTKAGAALDLHGQLLGWTDNLGMRLANHEYLKRDGGEVEPMGAQQGRWGFRCCFLGVGVTDQWRNLTAAIRREPRGKLDHPRLGTFDAACEGAHAAENPETAIDSLDFTIDFVEDSITSIFNDADIGPQVRAAQATASAQAALDAWSGILSNRIANTVYAACTAAIVNFQAWVNKFQAQAIAASQATTPDLTLEKLLGNVKDRRDVALAALAATLPFTLEQDVSLVPARTQLYVSYAACAQLYQTIIAQQPALISFTVPAAMPLTSVAVRVYGKDARAKMDEIYSLNRIPTPHWVPAGTVLRLVAPVVRQ